MMKTFGSVSITSHRSSDSVSSEATDEVWSPEPSSGYGSADDEHPNYDLRTPTRTTPGRSLSESSGGISSRSLLSLSLSEALSLTFCESPPPSPPPPPPPPPDDVLPFQDLVDYRSPGSSIDYESSLSSAVPTPSNNEFQRIISFQPDAISFLGRLQPCSKRTLEKHRGVEPQTVTKVVNHSLPSEDIQTDLSSIETNSVQDPSEDSRFHKRIRLQHTSCSEENNDLSYAFGSRMTAWSSRSCSIRLRKKATIDEVRKEQYKIPAALVSLQFDGSVVEKESVADDDAVCLATADGDLKKLLPIAEVQRSSDGKTVSTTPSHRLPAGPSIEPRRNFDASSSPEHSTDLFDEDDLHRFCHDDFDREFSATDCYEAPHFAADTNSTSSTTTPTSPPTPIGSTTSKDSTTSTGSTSCIVPTVSNGYNNSVDLKAFRIAVGLFHSYAAVKETPESSCHSATSPGCSPQLQDLGFIGHDTIEDLGYDPMLPDAQTTLPGHSLDLHDVSMSTWSTTNEEVLQDPIEDACNVVDESSRSGNAPLLSTDSMQRIASSKRSRSSSSCRQSSKRRRRHSSPALAELADHGYALKAACGPATLHRSSTSPCVATVEEEESTADVSSVLAKLLLTEERLFPNEGSAGFIARGHCGQGSAEDSAKSQDPSGGQSMSGSLLERLLTGQMDRDEIQKSEERVIRDRLEARPDNDDVADDDVDLQLQDFDPGSLELENLEELWKNHGDLLGKFLA